MTGGAEQREMSPVVFAAIVMGVCAVLAFIIAILVAEDAKKKAAADWEWRYLHGCKIAVIKGGYPVVWVCEGGVEWRR